MSRVKTVPPEEIREVGPRILEHLEVRSGDSLVLVEGDDFVLVKRAAPPPPDLFERLSEETRARFERLGLAPDEAVRAVRWARESS